MAPVNSTQTSVDSLPTHAQVVIIGGGVIGCSVAYHLTKLGWRDVVLLERKELTAGTTWHAAGLVVCGGFSTETMLNMAKYTRDLYAVLGEETGQDTGFKAVGYLELAPSQEWLEGLRRVADFANSFGVPVEEISTSEVQKMWPLFDTSDVLAGFYTAADGRANPVDVTMSLAKGARMGGVGIFEGTKVTGIKKKNGRVCGVVTDKGEIEAEYVVNCCGFWGREVGKMAGVKVPLHAAEHYYLITEPIEGLHKDLPIVEDPTRYAYYREEVGGLMLGLFEPVAGPWGMNGVPEDFSFGELPPDWDRLMPYIDHALERIPVARNAGVHKLFCGPEYFNLQYKSARHIRKSPIYDRLAEAGAFFASYAGWEYPDWFAPPGVDPIVEYSWGRQNWFEYNAAEHRAAREAVVLMDYSLMSKILVQGRDAEKVLNRICSKNLTVRVGTCVYTTMLNEAGKIEADLTVTRLAEDRYLVVVTDSLNTHVKTWLQRHIPPDAHAFVTDMTSAYTLLNLQGPKARQLLSQVTHADISNEAFPYLTMQEIDIGYASVIALRITYLGELGWELYVPSEFALHVFDTLVGAGKQFGLKHAGLQTLETLRIEKAYRSYGVDIDNTDTPLEVGLGFTVDFDKPGGFIGKEALLQHKQAGVPKYRLVQFLLKDLEPLLYGGEPVFRNGELAGYLSAGAYGHTLGGAVGLGHVENKAGVTIDYVNRGAYEIQIAGVRCPAKASLRPMYDPKNQRVRS